MKVIEHYIFFEDTGWFELFKLEGHSPHPYKWARSIKHLTQDRRFITPISEAEALTILKNIKI